MSTETVPKGYKRTEVGVIPEEWICSDLGSICNRVTTGKLDANAMVENGEYRFYTCARSWYYINSFAFDDEALLISGNGANVGYIHYYNGKFNAYQRTYVLAQFNASIKYLQHYMGRNLSDRIRVEVNAGNTPYITRGTLTEMQLALPPTVAEQQAIAAALSDADALIESLEQLLAKKRQIKQGAMQELLTGKRRLPGFSGEWETKKFPDVCWFQEGPGVRNTQFTDSGIKLLNGTNIASGHLDLSTTSRFIAESEAYGPYAHFMADINDIVLASSGITIEKLHNKVAIVTESDLPFCMNTSTIRFKPASILNHSFLFQYLKSDLFKNEIGGQATGSAQLNFGPSHVATVSINLPPLPEQTAIAAVLSDIDSELEAIEAKLDKARQVKQGMMQQLLTGKVRLV